MHKSTRRLAGTFVPLLIAGALGFGVSASASTPGCTGIGSGCGDNVNAFGNGWDVLQQKGVYGQPVVSWPDTVTDPATDFTRATVAFHVYRYQYAPKGRDTGLCPADPGDGKVVLRGCNTGPWQQWRVGSQGSGGNQLVNVATGREVTTNGTGAQLTTGGGYTGGSYFTWEAGGTTPVTATATTAVSNDPDSGDHGVWATDTFNRTVTLYEHGAAALSDCSAGATSCYLYSGRLSDSGTFSVANGASSPRDGTTVHGPLGGKLNGGGSYSFYASSAAPEASLVVSSHSDANVPGVAPFTSGTWYENFFPAGTHFGGTGLLDTWSWTYTTTSSCVSPAQTWVDAASNGAGASSAGDITGSVSC